jgi:putative membrane protein insertion efficiency factor
MLTTAWQAVSGACGAACQYLLTLLVRGYRFWLKPWLGNTCRFEPSCSAYALQALKQHGAARGAALAGWRLARCHPWCDGGCDPVPDVWTSAWARQPGAPKIAGSGLFTALISTSTTEAPSATADDAPVNRKRT